MLLLPRQAPRAVAAFTRLPLRQAPRALRTITRRLASARAEPQFLHLAPSGDFWVGSAIYAAKHNPSDYVRSLPLPIGQIIPEDCPHEALVKMYDSKEVDAEQLRPAWSAGDPTAAVVPPGLCQLTDEFSDCVLEERIWVSDDSFVVRFGLPDSSKPLNLSTCACILAGHKDDVRPYTPISTNAMVGSFELLVRAYPNGALSQRLATMEVDEAMPFKHIKFNVKTQYPFSAKKVGMLAGGTGITPMLQALHALLGAPVDETEVSLVYGSKTPEGILARYTLHEWEAENFWRFKVSHVLGGVIGEDHIRRHLPSPSEDCVLFVCGPDLMYNALCGPRGDPEVTGLLKRLGYSKSQVYKF
jgi:cytochrome-b5 reductase